MRTVRRAGRLRRWTTRQEYALKTSRAFSLRRPGTRVFYPGCSLPGNDPELTVRVFEHLRRQDPELGLWFDCCGAPLALSGDHDRHQAAFDRLEREIRRAGIVELITACGNCLEQFQSLRARLPELRLTSLYARLAQQDWPHVDAGTLTVHHPCPARLDHSQKDAFFSLADRLGLQIENRARRAHRLPCCLDRDAAAVRRRRAAASLNLVTYCAHCTASFQRDIDTRHVLQLIFPSPGRWQARGKVARFQNYRRFMRRIGPSTP